MKPGHTYVRKLTESQKQEAVARYKSGQSVRKIADVFGLDGSSIHSLIRRRGVQGRPHTEANRKHTLKQDAFDKVTSDSAYWIGFIMADGCITERPYSIYLTVAVGAKDADHINRLRAFLGSSHRIGSTRASGFNDGGARGRVLSVPSAKLATALARYGVTPRKSLTAKVSLLENNPHFWRGVVDGDGFIFLARNQPTIGMVGSRELLEQFRDYIAALVPGSDAHPVPMGTIWSFRVSGVRAVRVMESLYRKGCTALPRKLAAAQQIVLWYRKRLRERERRRVCKIKGCGLATEAKGYCLKHYKRNRKHGSPHLVVTSGRNGRLVRSAL